MSARLDVDSLRALKAVVDFGGVTRASDFLALSQSAVSHKIRRLEESINRQLLTRQSGGPLLTEDGDRLLGYAERIITLHDEALHALGRKTLKGRIRLGITEDTTSRGLARILARFTRLYPQVSVRTHVDQSLALSRQLDKGRIDVAVMQLFESEIRDTDIVLDVDELFWVQALDFNPAGNTPVPFIAFDKNCFYRQWALHHATDGDCVLSIETVLECSSITGVCNAVLAGLGVTLINGRNCTDGMRTITEGFPVPPSICYVVRCAPERASSSMEALTKEIACEFQT